MNPRTTAAWLSLPPAKRHHRSTSTTSEASTVRSEVDDGESVVSCDFHGGGANGSTSNMINMSSIDTEQAGRPTEFDDSFYNTFENLSTRHPADLVSLASPTMQTDRDSRSLHSRSNRSPSLHTDTTLSLPSPTVMDSVMIDPPFLVSSEAAGKGSTGIWRGSATTKQLDVMPNHFVSEKFVNVQSMSQQSPEQMQLQQKLIEQCCRHIQAIQYQALIQENEHQQQQPLSEYDNRHGRFHLASIMVDGQEEDMVDDIATIFGRESEPSDSDKGDLSAEEDEVDELDGSDSDYVERTHSNWNTNATSPHHDHQRSASNVSISSKSMIKDTTSSDKRSTPIVHLRHPPSVTNSATNRAITKRSNKPVRRRKGMYTPIQTEAGEKRFLCAKCGITFKRSHDLTRHMRALHEEGGKPFTCRQCKRAFNRGDALRRHQGPGRPCHVDESVSRGAR
ncbi:hypothetical protein SeLEV6574_g00004 [Synchytrium endobioticum]|nr:hypothetical protein SeLEV6574_g00004 [Synchytrium endobioticum]